MENSDFENTVEHLECTGFKPLPDKVHIAIPAARDVLSRGIKYFIGDNATWLPEYHDIAEWLNNNKGRGLLCIGNCGLGKTLICGKIIPILINFYHKLIVSCYTAQQVNSDIDAVLNKHIIYVDDVGVENESVNYGNRRLAFADLVYEAERCGKLLIVTTNLSQKELENKYGVRTVDRLRAITKQVYLKGKSLRK